MNVWYVNPPGRWDEALTMKALRGQLWNTPAFTEYLERPDQCDVAVVSHIPRCEPGEPRLIIHTSDESHQWQTPRGVRTWMEYATPEHQGDRNILIGCPGDTRELLPARKPLSERRLDWAFSGQVNHASRYKMAEVLKARGGGELYPSQGFSSGLPREQHLRLLTECRMAPCPAGNVHPDSFRLAESLEAGCVPAVEKNSFWDEFNIPFPQVDCWENLPTQVTQEQANIAGAWWTDYKRNLAYSLLDEMGLQPNSPISVIVTSSPIKSHPDTAILEETIQSIKARLPDSEILLCCDGIHPSQEQYRERYEEYKRRIIDARWDYVLPIIFPSWTHQMGMVRYALEKVRTPYVLFAEHDTPLLGEIPFSRFTEQMECPMVNSIRLYHLPQIPEEVRYMFGATMGNLAKTFQFSSRPYLAKTEWLKGLLREHFDSEEKTFIEPRLESIYRHGGWEQWNGMWVYAPENMQRSTHSDGRQGEQPVPEKETRRF